MIRIHYLRPACFALILLTTNIAFAADKWSSVRSQNFLLVGNGSDAQIRRVARNLEQFRSAFQTLFPGAQKSSVGTTVVVFRDDSAFKPFKPLYEGKPANVAGYFQSGADVNFIALDGDIETPRIIYHEFMHSLTKDATIPLPPWASEGLAEFYSTFQIGGNNKTVDLGRLIPEHVGLLRQNQRIPLETLLSVRRDSPYYNERTKQGIFYAQSWALVHYLMNANEGRRRPQFSKYLTMGGNGKTTEENFREAFQTDYAGLEKELDTYLHLLAWPFLKVQLSEKLDFERSMVSSPISEAQSSYYLGDLMLHLQRFDIAEKQLQSAISLEPNFAAAHASMGMLRLRQEKRQEALGFLTTAVERDSGNHLAHYYYAFLLQRLAENETAEARTQRLALMRTHLKKSIEIAPHFVEPYSWLAYVAISLREELDETEAAIGNAIKLYPAREELRLSLARVLATNRKTAAARAVVSQLRSATDDAMIRDQSTTLLENLNQAIESEQAMREYEERRRAAPVNPTAPFEESATVTRTTSVAPTDGPPTITRKTPSETAEPGSSDKPSRPSDRRVSGPEIEGMLTLIDCSQGMTLQVRVGNGIVKLHTDDPSKIDFVSYTKTVKDNIGCGPVKPELHVVIVYRRGTDPAFLGEPLAVEFRQ